MRYLYITGLMRSGTTIFSNFLNTQKHITIYRDFLVTLRNNTMNKNDNIDLKNKDLLQALEKEAHKINVRLDLNHLRVKDITDIYKSCLHAISSSHDKIVGNKCTQSLPILKKLLIDPNISGIYMVRDIRDVILSTKARYKKLSRNKIELLTEQCHQWNKEVGQALKLQKRYPDSFLLIKYEDFVQKKAINQVEKFLRIRLDWEVKKFKDRHGDKFIHNSSYGSRENVSGLFTHGIGRWKTEKKDRNYITEAESICQKKLVYLGY